MTFLIYQNDYQAAHLTYNKLNIFIHSYLIFFLIKLTPGGLTGFVKGDIQAYDRTHQYSILKYSLVRIKSMQLSFSFV